MPSTPITSRLDQKTYKKLNKLAKATKRSKSFLVAEAVDKYLQEQEWQIAAIKEGLKQADNGDFASDSEVRKFFSERRIIED